MNVNNCTANKGISALMYSTSNEEAFKFLISQPTINVNHQCNEKDTALMWAARKGRLQIVELLLKAGADVCVQIHFSYCINVITTFL